MSKRNESFPHNAFDCLRFPHSFQRRWKFVNAIEWKPPGEANTDASVSVRWCVCIDQYDYDERWFMPHLVRDEKCEPYWEDLLSEGSSPHHTENPLTAGQNPNQANYGTNSLYEPQSRENVTKPPGLPWKGFFFCWVITHNPSFSAEESHGRGISRVKSCLFVRCFITVIIAWHVLLLQE